MKFFALFAVVWLTLVCSVFAETDAERCAQPEDGGVCMAYFEKYAYDTASGECKKFIYGGCQGNTNRFDSKQECEDVCKK